MMVLKLGEGARTLLARAVEAEVADFLARHADRTTADGRRRIVRHGHLPERSIMTGIGPATVRQPRVRDRAGDAGERIRFSPNILPRYARRTKSLEVLIPILYLKGVSTGDFEEALSALVGADAPGLSASTIARLKEAWSEEHERWRKRDLSAKRYVYWWVDGSERCGDAWRDDATGPNKTRKASTVTREEMRQACAVKKFPRLNPRLKAHFSLGQFEAIGEKRNGTAA